MARQPRQPRETKRSCRVRTAPQGRDRPWSSEFFRSRSPFACLAWFAGNPSPFLGLWPSAGWPLFTFEGLGRDGARRSLALPP
jgi:hypothetical protein